MHSADLVEQRNRLRADADAILTRATTESRDLTADELRDHGRLTDEIRQVDDRLDDARDAEIRELRAAGVNSAAPAENRGGLALAAELRALSGSGTTNGGAFTPTDFGSYFFDRLSAQAVALRSGITVVRTDRDSLTVPRLTADASSAWTSEAGTITATDPTADQITATPRKLAALTQISNEALADSNPSLLQVVSDGLTRSIALKFDLGVYEGSGSAPEIRGLKNVAGIGSVSMGTNGATPTNLDPIADSIGTLLQANSYAQPVVVMHPRTWQTLSKIKEVSGSTKPILQNSAGSGSQGLARELYGAPVLLSSQLSITETQGTSTDCSSIYVYDPSQVVAVIRQDVRVELDSSRLFNSDQSEIRAVMRADLVVPNPAAVVRVVGVRP